MVVKLERSELAEGVTFPIRHPRLQILDDAGKLARRDGLGAAESVPGVHGGGRAGAGEGVDGGGAGTDGRRTGEGELGRRRCAAGRVEKGWVVEVGELDWRRVTRRHLDGDHAGEMLLFGLVRPLD